MAVRGHSSPRGHLTCIAGTRAEHPPCAARVYFGAFRPFPSLLRTRPDRIWRSSGCSASVAGPPHQMVVMPAPLRRGAEAARAAPPRVVAALAPRRNRKRRGSGARWNCGRPLDGCIGCTGRRGRGRRCGGSALRRLSSREAPFRCVHLVAEAAS
eukprot:scaffold28704_cov101-Isochrysis_galbana.AAC.4